MSASLFETLLVLYARRFPLQRGKLRVIDKVWKTVVGNQTHRVAELKYGNFKMPCDVSQMLQRQFYFFGTYFLEDETLDCWTAAAKGAKVVLDVGANAGIFSLAALASQTDATVHAFEPTPEIAARLRATAQLNQLNQLHVHEAAVTIKNGYGRLRRFAGESGTNDGMNFITSDVTDSTTERVRTICLDQFCEDHSIDHVDLLKLDIQGHEHNALAGAQQLINAGRIGTIFVELNWADGAANSCPASESIRRLDEAGYRFSPPTRHPNWQKAGEWLRPLGDVVASRTQ